MGKRPTFGLLCCAMLLSTSAWAATLQPGQGSLSVNDGQGFQPVNSRVDANVGDSVMVSPGGSATIVYDDGCKVPVEAGQVATVAPLSPCASGSYAQGDNGNDFDWTGVAFGVGVATVAGFAGYEASRSGGSTTAASPASP